MDLLQDILVLLASANIGTLKGLTVCLFAVGDMLVIPRKEN